MAKTIVGTVERPDYMPLHGAGNVILRRFGSETTHYAKDPSSAISLMVATKWIGPSYWALHEPWVALCGVILRPDHRGLVVMQPTKAKCRVCRRLLGPRT